MYFGTKSYLKTARNHTVKHAQVDMHRGGGNYPLKIFNYSF
jgi:hypothetical protein